MLNSINELRNAEACLDFKLIKLSAQWTTHPSVGDTDPVDGLQLGLRHSRHESDEVGGLRRPDPETKPH